MLDRRRFLELCSVGASASMLPMKVAVAAPARLLFVHGRDQQGQDPTALKATWIDTLARGAQAAGRTMPNGIAAALPFYGNILDGYAQNGPPLTAEIRAKGEAAVDKRFLEFQAEFADDLRRQAGITDEQILTEYAGNPRPRGPQNWEWVQAIVRAIDRYGGRMSQSSIESLMRDVYLYTTSAGVRDEIDRIIRAELTAEPTVVVGHSLGAVVTYNVLRSDPRPLNVPLYVTVGAPLAIRAIREQLTPLRFPPSARVWLNAFDTRDIVALYPLDGSNFPVVPPVENYSGVKNHTDNRHGIVGYLDDPVVAGRILDAASA